MAALSDDIHSRIQTYCKKGDALAEKDKFSRR